MGGLSPLSSAWLRADLPFLSFFPLPVTFIAFLSLTSEVALVEFNRLRLDCSLDFFTGPAATNQLDVRQPITAQLSSFAFKVN